MSTAVRQFAFWVANKSVGYPLLNNTDYSNIINEPSALEMTFAIFMNNLELDGDGKVLNRDYAGKRAAQYIKSYFDCYSPLTNPTRLRKIFCNYVNESY